MSLALDPIESIEIIEPTIEMKTKKVFGIFKGGSNNTYYSYNATSSSLSQSNWNINTPSENMFIDRKMYIHGKFKVHLFGDAIAPKRLLQNGADALRAYPLQNSMSTLTTQINSGSVTQNSGDIVQALMRYVKYDEQYYELSVTPNYLDQDQNYKILEDSFRNPLNAYHDSVDGAFIPRGAFPMKVIQNPSGLGVEAIVEVEIMEPLMISPLHFNRSHANGFIGVKTLNFQITWKSPLFRYMWSHFDKTGITLDESQCHVEFLQDPTLLIRVINPSELNSLKIPELTVYPYHRLELYTTDKGALATGEQATEYVNSVQLSVIPRRIFLWVERNQTVKSVNETDTFMAIDKISINFANKDGILASATKRQLYNISKKNGVNMPWSVWSGEAMPNLGSTTGGEDDVENFHGVGSVLCLYIPEDIAITNSDLLAPSVAEKANIQIEVKYTNFGPAADKVRIKLVVDNEGIFTLTNGIGIPQTGILTKDNVLNAKRKEGVDYEDVIDLYGGDFFSDVGSFFKRLPANLRKGFEFSEKNILPFAKLLLPLLGAGEDEMTQEELMKDMRKEVKRKGGKLMKADGGILVGGRKITRKQLRDKLKKL